MNKKNVIMACLTMVFVITTCIYRVQNIRINNHNMYHRSRMFEYELLANLYKIFPVGTPLDSFLSKLQLDKSIAMTAPESQTTIVDIYPELPIPEDEQRDYSGYYVEFKNGCLIRIVPTGPDMARNIIKLSELDIGKEIYYFQRP